MTAIASTHPIAAGTPQLLQPLPDTVQLTWSPAPVIPRAAGAR